MRKRFGISNQDELSRKAFRIALGVAMARGARFTKGGTKAEPKPVGGVCNNVTMSVNTTLDNSALVPAQKLGAEQPSLDVSRIELSERLRRVRNPSNLALLADYPPNKVPRGRTLNALLYYMALTGKRFDEALRNLSVRV